MDLSCTTRVEGCGTVVKLNGELDRNTAPLLAEHLDDLIHAGHLDLIVDLQNVEFMDSACLGVLIQAHQQVSDHGGSVRVICAHERIIKVFRITGMTDVFPIHAGLEEVAAAHRVSAESTRQRSGRAPSAPRFGDAGG